MTLLGLILLLLQYMRRFHTHQGHAASSKPVHMLRLTFGSEGQKHGLELLFGFLSSFSLAAIGPYCSSQTQYFDRDTCSRTDCRDRSLILPISASFMPRHDLLFSLPLPFPETPKTFSTYSSHKSPSSFPRLEMQSKTCPFQPATL